MRRTSTLETRFYFMIILLSCSTPSDAPDLHNCAKILILTIPHAAQASPDIRKGGGSGMKQCTEPVRYPCWRFYRNREEMDIVSNKYEDFNGLTVDREAVTGVRTLKWICQLQCDTNKGESNHTQSNCTESNSTEGSCTGFIIAIVCLVIFLAIAAVLLAIALPHMVLYWCKRCTQRRTEGPDRRPSVPVGTPDGTGDQPTCEPHSAGNETPGGNPVSETQPPSDTESPYPGRRPPAQSMQRDQGAEETGTTDKDTNAGQTKGWDGRNMEDVKIPDVGDKDDVIFPIEAPLQGAFERV